MTIKYCPVETLNEWIERRLQEKDWRPADLARAAGIRDATLSRILNQGRQAGPDVCNAIARAFREPPDKVFRLAGLLPKLPAPASDPTLGEILEIAKQLTPEERHELLDYALWRYKRGNQTREAT